VTTTPIAVIALSENPWAVAPAILVFGCQMARSRRFMRGVCHNPTEGLRTLGV
jgi:hypothetical protein